MSNVEELAIVLYPSLCGMEPALLGARLPRRLAEERTMQEVQQKLRSFVSQYQRQYQLTPVFTWDGVCPRCALLLPSLSFKTTKQKANELSARLQFTLKVKTLQQKINGGNFDVRKALEAPYSR